MKKEQIFIFAILLLVWRDGTAQDFKLNDLYIPSAPGLILGDKAPSSVDKPTTPRAFGVSVLNFIQGGSMEVTPYWLVNRPEYTFEKWLDKKFMAIQSLNLSVSSFKEQGSYGVAPGIRSQILKLYTKSSKGDIIRMEEKIIDLLSDTDSLGNLVINEAAIHAAQDELDVLMAKGLFSVDFAGAMLSTSSGNTFRELSTQKYGAWLSATYSPGKLPLSFTGLARYTWTAGGKAVDADTSKLDFGARMSFTREKFDIALEYISRSDFSNKKHADRFALVCNYVYSENIILVTSFGKNFADTDNIITTLGLKFGMSREKKALSSE